ncbi:hypothetical protein [Streptomyces sp. NPDC002082]|uniref:hypothetical protein n=1 Tax=Streptomyces sp. NPDC002082 TaxID=3154772 RepID=UPI003316D7A5
MLHPIEDLEAERSRASLRPESAAAPPVLAHVELAVDGDPARYASRLRGVLDAVLHIAATEDFDADDDLPAGTVPGWFSAVCRGGGSPEPFAAEGRDRYTEWTGGAPWALQNWLSRFDPDLEVRGWAWWDLTAAPTGNGVLRLWVDTWGEPSFAWEDLRWLAFVAGARTVANPVLVKPEAWAGELSVGAGGETALMVDWTPGDATVRWSGPAGDVEKAYEVPPQSVMAWRERGETLVLVVEECDSAPFTPSDNAVVYEADGSERFRLHPPHDLLRTPSDVHGFYFAMPQDGRPLLIMVTRNAGDFQGRIDLETGEITDTNTWR